MEHVNVLIALAVIFIFVGAAGYLLATLIASPIVTFIFKPSDDPEQE